MSERFVFRAYAVGLVHTSACTSLTNEQATARLNEESPTGITSRWEVSAENFASGEVNGRACDIWPDTHRHLLFVC